MWRDVLFTENYKVHHLKKFERSHVHITIHQVSIFPDTWFWRKKDFTIYGHGCHLVNELEPFKFIFLWPRRNLIECLPRRCHMKVCTHLTLKRRSKSSINVDIGVLPCLYFFFFFLENVPRAQYMYHTLAANRKWKRQHSFRTNFPSPDPQSWIWNSVKIGIGHFEKNVFGKVNSHDL